MLLIETGYCSRLYGIYYSKYLGTYCFTFFKGAHSSADEQGTAALKAVEIDDRLGGAPVQVRVVQGKEPPHFLAIFQGKLVIYQGGLSSSFDGK